jgi:hypothetical protein
MAGTSDEDARKKNYRLNSRIKGHGPTRNPPHEPFLPPEQTLARKSTMHLGLDQLESP